MCLHVPDGGMVRPSRGRPRRSLYHISDSPYDIDLFRTTLRLIEGDPVNWSLKTEWREFYKLYFRTAYPKDKNVKSAYNFFKKNQCALVPSVDKARSIPPCNSIPVKAINLSLPWRADYKICNRPASL